MTGEEARFLLRGYCSSDARYEIEEYIESLERELEAIKATAKDGTCAVCGEQHESHCPKCGRNFTEADTYCLNCGHIRAHGRAKGGY